MSDEMYNYKISLDNGDVEMYCVTNAGYQEAYELFSKWFQKERYSGEYRDLEDFMLGSGYLMRERGLNNGNAILIDLNSMHFE